MNGTPTPMLAIAAAAAAALFLAGCGGGGSKPMAEGPIPTEPPAPTTPGTGIGPAGPRLAASNLSAIPGADDEFAPDIAGALARAAGATPLGASQSSQMDNGTTRNEWSVRVGRNDDGHQVYEVSDGSRIALHVPGLRTGFDLALFTDLLPGIEPDLSSYPHELFGLWAWEGEVGAFWGMSPEIPQADLNHRLSPSGTARYDGDAAALYAAHGNSMKVLADVMLTADFEALHVSGSVGGFRTLHGERLDVPSVTLGPADFSSTGEPFSGSTSSSVPGSGMWGARWSDDYGWSMGGTYGFAASDESMALLGAFGAQSGASAAGGQVSDGSHAHD